MPFIVIFGIKEVTGKQSQNLHLQLYNLSFAEHFFDINDITLLKRTQIRLSIHLLDTSLLDGPGNIVPEVVATHHIAWGVVFAHQLVEVHAIALARLGVPSAAEALRVLPHQLREVAGAGLETGVVEVVLADLVVPSVVDSGLGLLDEVEGARRPGAVEVLSVWSALSFGVSTISFVHPTNMVLWNDDCLQNA